MDIISVLKGLSNTNLADNTNIHPSKHREVNDAIIDALTPVNYGAVTGIEQDSGSGSVDVVLGNITSATYVSESSRFAVTCNLENAMPDTDYIVKTYVESKSGTIHSDNNLGQIVFKVISTTQFEVAWQELASAVTQDITIHFEVISRPY